MQHHSHPKFIRISTRESAFLWFIAWIIPNPSQTFSNQIRNLISWPPSRLYLFAPLATETGTGAESWKAAPLPLFSAPLTLHVCLPWRFRFHSNCRFKKEQRKYSFHLVLVLVPLRPGAGPGHVVFRGNKVLDQQEGLGVWSTENRWA